MTYQPCENDLLVIVDMQNDFVTGALGTAEAQAIVEKMAETVKNFPGDLYLTRDTHEANYKDTQEGRRLPVEHCINGTHGHDFVHPIRNAIHGRDCVYLTNKNTFGSKNFFDFIKHAKYRKIYFCGVCTGICVIANAILAKTADPEAEITILENLCACVTPETHRTAIAAMQNLQMDIVFVP